MKLIHVSDLHLGKYLHGTSLIDDQKYWVDQFVKVVEEEKPDAIMMAGDIYDRSVAPKEAIKLFDDMITRLSHLDTPVMMVAGNHDSGIRLASMSELLKKSEVYIAGEVNKEIMHVTLQDAYGDVTFWLVPYLYPAAVESALGVEGIKDYTEALQKLLEQQSIDYSKRNVIVSHQMVTNQGNEPEKGGSEEMVGGIGGVDVSLYEPFDYAALGHIHAAQCVKYDHIRYAGSPLCYHFDELKKPNKGPIVVELGQKGEKIQTSVRTLDVLHPLRQEEGTLQEIIDKERTISAKGEYVRVILTDDVLPQGAYPTLEELYNKKNSVLMEASYRPARIYNEDISVNERIQELSIFDGFQEFYKERTNEFMDETDMSFIKKLVEQIGNTDDDLMEPSDDDVDTMIAFMNSMLEVK